jgi:hypothetical protein
MKQTFDTDLEKKGAESLGDSGDAEAKVGDSERVFTTAERVNLGYLLEYVRRTRDLWDTDVDATDVTSECDDMVDGIPIKYESEPQANARMSLDAKKERAFSVRAKHMLDTALRVLKGKSNSRNFPRSVKEATTREDWPSWKAAIKKELMSIIKKGTFRDIQSRKKAKGKPLGTKMVLTIKYNADGSIERYYARFVVIGNHQVFGESYDETYAPTASMIAVRQLFAYAYAAEHELDLHQLDVQTAFLNAEMDYDVDVKLEPETVKVLQELAAELGIPPLDDR